MKFCIFLQVFLLFALADNINCQEAVAPQPNDCSNVRCAACPADQYNSGVPPNCCECLCPQIKCAKGYVSYIPEGKNCPACRVQVDCSNVRCAACPADQYNSGVPPNCCECLCPQIKCAKGYVSYIPEGKNCPACRVQVDCSNVRCAACPADQYNSGVPPNCCECLCPQIKCAKGYVSYIPEGKNCPACRVQVDCSNVRCAACPAGQKPVSVPGKCCQCQLCPQIKCANGSYIPNGKSCPECIPGEPVEVSSS